MSTPIRLSAQLTSTYRLFLRATSAAVLHHSTAKRNIRKLYRPIFDEAAQVEVQLQTTQDPQASRTLRQWLVNWNNRGKKLLITLLPMCGHLRTLLKVDNTLELLHNSATTRGLSHRLTRNIGFLTHAYLRSRKRKGQVWNPQLPASAPLYTIQPMAAPTAKMRTQQNRQAFDAAAFQSLGEVVKLAEARSSVSLGRLPTVSTSPR